MSNPFDLPPDFEVMSPDDPRAAEALAKSSPFAVNYHPAPDSKERCSNCAMFKPVKIGEHGVRDVDSCTSVRGMIWDDWVCDLFEPAIGGEAEAG